MASIEELSSSDEDSSMLADALGDLSSSDSDDDMTVKDPLSDFERVNADSARASRDAAAHGQPVDLSNPVDVEEKKEEPLIVEDLPAEEMERRIKEGEALKVEGNDLYAANKYPEAIEKYTMAIQAAPRNHPNTAIYLSNRAACHVAQGAWRFAVDDTTLALKLQPKYLKAIARRAHAYEELKQLQEAVNDLKLLLELDSSYKKAAEPRIARMEKELEEKRKKEQEEMIGQLKDMGNKFLGLFGLSLDNFKAEQDASGSYKINFSQNK